MTQQLETFVEQAEESKVADLTMIQEFVKTHKIVDQQSLLDATEFLAKAKRAIKLYDEKRLDLTRGLKATVKKIEEIFKAKTNPLDEAISKLSASILKYNQELQQKRLKEAQENAEREKQERIKKAQEEAEAAKLTASIFGDEEEEEAVAEAEQKVEEAKQEIVKVEPVKTAAVRTMSGTSTIRKDWTYEVVSLDELAKSRVDLVIENSVAIRQAIRNGEREIPGLRIYQKETLSVR